MFTKLNWGIVTDEITTDICDAIRIAASWGINRVELRNIGKSQRIPDISKEQIKKLKHTLQECGSTITALSPGTWKCSLHDPLASRQNDVLCRTLDLAQDLLVNKVITFGVKRDPRDHPSDYKRVSQILHKMTELALKQDITLCLENEPGWWNDSLESILRVHRDLSSSGLLMNYDPGNLVDAGESDVVSAYQQLKPWIANIHIKDVDISHKPHKSCLLGKGHVDWPSLLTEIIKDRQHVDMTIETHCQPLITGSKYNYDWLKNQVKDSIPDN